MDRRPGIIGLLGEAAWFFCKENDISLSKAAFWDVRQSSEKKLLGRRVGPDFWRSVSQRRAAKRNSSPIAAMSAGL